MPKKKIYTIWCVLANEGSLFSIKIESSEPVDELRKMIKDAKNALAKYDAVHLKLYHVEISDLADMARDDIVEIVEQKLSERPIELGAMKELADVFKDGVKEETLIIVQHPNSGKWRVLGKLGQTHERQK